MQPIETEVNPYQTPGIDRLHHTSVYTWPLAADKSITFEVEIDKEQLLKCVAENHRSSKIVVLATVLLAIGFAISFISWISDSSGGTPAWICLVTLAGLFYFGPRCFLAWHVRRFHSQYSWMWGRVSGTIDSTGLRWRSEAVELQQHWDSFYQLTWWPNTLWLSTSHPFLMEIPIRREWVGEANWGDLRQAAESHKSIYDKQNFWKFSRPIVVKYQDVAAPDNEDLPEGALSFRANGLGGKYGCEIAQSLLQLNGLLFFATYMLCIFAESTSYVRQLKATFGITENGTLLFPCLALLYFTSFVYRVTRWFPAGPGFFQWSQTLLSSQSGYVSQDSVRVASPACSVTAQLGGEITLQRYRDCMVLQLHRKFAQSLVIPNDQFAPPPV